MTRITGQAGSAGSLYDNSYISRMLRQFDERLDIMNDQYIRIEDRYYRQFTACLLYTSSSFNTAKYNALPASGCFLVADRIDFHK